MKHNSQNPPIQRDGMQFDLASPLDDATAWRLVREAAGHVIVIMDTFSVVHYVSPNVSDLFGHGVDDLLGRSILDLSPSDDIARLADGHESVMQGGIVLARQRLRTGSGRWAWVETTSRLVENAQGRWIVCTVRREPGEPGAAAWSPDQ